jgi:hypothetical protein
MMRPTFRHGAIALALLGLVGLAVAGELGALSSDRMEAADETTGRNVSGGAQSTAPALSLEEKSRIFAHVMRIPDVPVADVEPPAPSVALPRSVALQDLPTAATQEVPQVKGYKFVKLNDWILLVNPASRTVVAEMPRYKLMD